MGNNLNNEEIKLYIKRLVNDVTDIALALAMPDESRIEKQTTEENDDNATNINNVSNEATESTSEVKSSSTS
jgi:hypothetical protein